LGLALALVLAPDISVRRCAPMAIIPIIPTPAHLKATTVLSGSSVGCLLGQARGTTGTMDPASIDLALITAEGMATDGMVHMLSLTLGMATIAEPFAHIAALWRARRLAADSGLAPVVSAAALDVASLSSVHAGRPVLGRPA
jgi:hypothetical protein